MRHRFLVCAVIMIAVLNLQATTIFVKQGASGAGNSWADATGDLNAALFIAQPGDQVWVAKGAYYPTNQKDRRISFTIPSNVKVYGGFNGNETSLGQRDAKAQKSILSGNIGSKTDHADNSYTVVFIKNAEEGTLLDGFIVADGNADGVGPSADKDRCGAGIYIDGSGQGSVSKPVIQNCIFQNNYGRDGGAAYVNGRGGICNPTFTNCEFQSNKVDLDGGAIFNDGRHRGMANTLLQHCVFSGNQANYGGAICNYGGKGQCNPIIKSCIFRNNEAYLRGGAIFNMDVEGEAKPVINDCQFVDNQAVAGEGIYTFSKPEPREKTEQVKLKSN
jgi:Chlamydia polymorphic membrane protein (Chlamydia_PMP) repeat